MEKRQYHMKGYIFVGHDRHPVPLRNDLIINSYQDGINFMEKIKLLTQQMSAEEDQVQGYLFALV